MVKQICIKCKTSKILDDFHKNKSRKNGHTNTCKKCRKLVHETHYNNNKNKYKENKTNRKLNIKKHIKDIKLKSKCKICEYDTCSEALDFHHIDNKTMSISDMVTAGYSLKSIKNEIKKCIILCKNCHTEHHVNKI